MAEKILITGASGLVGTRLTELLLQKGRQVVHVGRRARAGRIPCFEWDINAGKFDLRALEGVDTIIHLAGAGVADKRWTPERKRELHDSRVRSLDLLYKQLRNAPHGVRTLVSASGIGYYGVKDNERMFVESDPPGDDFLARLVVDWEDASRKIEDSGIRVVGIRIGIVLSEKGGALKSMAQPVRYGLGAPLGSGKQYLSWVHLDDLCEAFDKASGDASMSGAYNVAGVSPVTNRELTSAIAKVLKRPLWLPSVPSFLLKIMLGEMSYIVTTGCKVSSDRILQTGFDFKFKNVTDALKDLYKQD